jgi:thiamine-monophosphate kinase
VRESELIEQLESTFRSSSPRVIRGIGDDAAVVRGAEYAVVSVDAMVDGVHFRSEQLSAAEIGHRALAGALSDLAAMGAGADEAYLVLGLPPGTEPETALSLARAARQLADQHDVAIAGGDVTESPCLTVSVTVVGWTSDPGELVGRDGARVETAWRSQGPWAAPARDWHCWISPRRRKNCPRPWSMPCTSATRVPSRGWWRDGSSPSTARRA